VARLVTCNADPATDGARSFGRRFATFGELNRAVIEPRGVIRIRPSHGCLLRDDAEEQQCLVVLLHAVPFDFAHDQLP
jgi:hypothetical protein